MENTTKLANLKLVNKYYPPISNYSYPRPETALRDEKPVGRSSVGSDCSAPGMTDDQESDISAEDANQYHLAGDELWDSFWEDTESLCSTQLEEEEQQQRAEANRNARYPALIPSTVSQQKANCIPPWEDSPTATRVEDQGAVGREEAVSCWPLAVTEQPVTPCAKAAKASYSLFPQPTPTPLLNLTPRRPSRPPRSGLHWESPPHFPLIPSQSSLGRTTKPKKLHLPTSDGAIKYHNAISVTHSAPVSPTVYGPIPPATTMSRRSEPNTLAQPRQTLTLPRICSDTTAVLYSMNTNTASQETLKAAATAAAPAIPPRSPQRNQGRHSRQQSQLRNSITAAELSSTTPSQPQSPPQSQPQVHAVCTPRPSCDAQWPTTPPPPPPPPPPPLPPSSAASRPSQQQQRPQKQDVPVPVSVFELDSDSDEDVNFARRIVRNLTPHKRTRSATAVSRSRKGGDLAKEQLRRARAGTVTSSSTAGTPASASASPSVPAPASSPASRASEDSASVVMRRQKGEVLGRLFGGRW